MTVALPIVYDEPSAEPADEPPPSHSDEVLALRAQGKTYREIAETLGIDQRRAWDLGNPNHTNRNRRQRVMRAKTVSIKRMTKRELEEGRALYPEADEIERPRTRGECVDGIRPCPFVGCAHHLYLDVSPQTGAIKFNFPDAEPDQMVESCALDVAEGRLHESLPIEPLEPDAEPADEDDAPAPAAMLAAAKQKLRFATSLENVARAMNITRERVRQIEERAIRKLTMRADRGVLAEFRGYESGRQELIPEHHFVSSPRAAAPVPQKPPPATSPAKVPPGGAGAVAPGDQPNRKERTMATCTREGCNNEARAPRKPVPPGQEGWCGDCRSRLEPPAGEAPVHRRRPVTRKVRPAAKVKPGLASVKLPRTTSIGDIVKAYELVMSVGLPVCQALAESSTK